LQATVLSAQLSDPANAAAAGMMTYMTCTVNGATMTQLIVNVHATAASTTLNVSIGSGTAAVIVGTITTDANGNGNLVLTSNPQNPGDQQLPSDFPSSISSGTAVSVGTLGGTLGAQTNPTPTPPPSPPPPPTTSPTPVQGTVLTAQLSDPNNAAATGMMTYMTGTVSNGATLTQLFVGVHGAAANSPLSVSIGSGSSAVVVGTINTDVNGNGNLVLSSNPQNPGDQQLPQNFPTSIAAGTAVSVGTLAGTLGTQVNPTPTPPPPPPPPVAVQGTVLTAQLSGPTATAGTGMMTYMTGTASNGTTLTQLFVGVHGAAANSTLSVSIGTGSAAVVVGSVATDGNGNGSLVLSSNPQGPGQQQLPPNFPTSIAAGTAVSVGTLTGTLGTPTTPTPTPPPAPSPVPVQGTLLIAPLSDPANPAANGMVTYMTSTAANNVTTAQLMVGVHGAAASSTLSVSIGSGNTAVVVGSVATDANGNGQVVLTSNLPANIAAGTPVSVGTLTGTLAPPPATPPQQQPPPASAQGVVLATPLADPSNPAATGMMTYMSGTGNGVVSTQLLVGVCGAAANSTLSVSIGSGNTAVVVGTITTDANGNGNLVLTTNPQNPGDQQLPTDFPATILVGTPVSVGTLDGILNPPPPPPKQ
jgi:hypothetical protein